LTYDTTGQAAGAQPATQQPQLEKLEVFPSLIKAYMSNMGKSIFFIAALVGSYYFVQHMLEANPIIDAFETLGIPVAWGLRAFIACSAIFLILAFFSTLSLTSYRLIFEGNQVTYSYGSFFKITRTTLISNIMRVNYKECSPFKTGEITLELTGTEDKTVTLQFISKAAETCSTINELVKAKKSATLNQIDLET